MAEIINLRQAKKQAARKAARSTADANAAKHGRTKAERALEQARAEKPPALWTPTSAARSNFRLTLL